MRNLDDIKKALWIHDHNAAVEHIGARACYVELPTGKRAKVVVGTNEGGWEHVSISLSANRLPSWNEMCYIKNLFWYEEEEVVQIHPKKSKYVNIIECLHLWRPVNGDWSLMNKE